VDSRVVAWIREFLAGRSQCWRRRALFEELKLTSGIPQGSVLGTLLFLAFVNDVWKNLEPTIKLFADDCIIYSKVINVSDVETLQIDLDTFGEWEAENPTVPPFG